MTVLSSKTHFAINWNCCNYYTIWIIKVNIVIFLAKIGNKKEPPDSEIKPEIQNVWWGGFVFSLSLPVI
jgi:hypothetical protein